MHVFIYDIYIYRNNGTLFIFAFIHSFIHLCKGLKRYIVPRAILERNKEFIGSGEQIVSESFGKLYFVIFNVIQKYTRSLFQACGSKVSSS